MKVSVKQLRRIIREALDTSSGPEFDETMSNYPSGVGGADTPDESQEDWDYSAIEHITTDHNLVRSFEKLKVNMEELKNALIAHPDPATMLREIHSNLKKVQTGSWGTGRKVSDPALYIATEIAQTLGLKFQKHGPVQIMNRKIRELMKTNLFKNADPKDKRSAAGKLRRKWKKIINDDEDFYEEGGGEALETRIYNRDAGGWIPSEFSKRLSSAAQMDPEDWNYDLDDWWSNAVLWDE
jgi:hypothetical protein